MGFGRMEIAVKALQRALYLVLAVAGDGGNVTDAAATCQHELDSLICAGRTAGIADLVIAYELPATAFAQPVLFVVAFDAIFLYTLPLATRAEYF